MGRPARRAWRVPVVSEDPDTGELYPDDAACAKALLHFQGILTHIGGRVLIEPDRIQLPRLDSTGAPTGETYEVTTELRIVWDSFSPLERLPEGWLEEMRRNLGITEEPAEKAPPPAVPDTQPEMTESVEQDIRAAAEDAGAEEEPPDLLEDSLESRRERVTAGRA